MIVFQDNEKGQPLPRLAFAARKGECPWISRIPQYLGEMQVEITSGIPYNCQGAKIFNMLHRKWFFGEAH